MNKLFIDNLVERLESVTCTNVYIQSQKNILRTLEINDCIDNFPMVCYEHTSDSNVEVDKSESKFLNDSAHNGLWLVGCDDDTVVFLLCLKDSPGGVEIDVLEVNSNRRGESFGKNIVDTVELIAEDYACEYILISPFDTDAINFWEHMGYVEGRYGNWVKLI